MDTIILIQTVFIGILVVFMLMGYRYRRAISLSHQPPSKTTSGVRPDTVYRIRRVPTEWSEGDLRASLKEQFRGSSFTIGSLAVEYHERSKTATVNCRKGTALPLSLRLRITGADTEAVDVGVDSDFHGITTLYAPPSEDHLVDIVAISGLGSHAYGSFKSKNRSDPHMWLRDSLPNFLLQEVSDRPMARVMLYGYDSQVAGSRSLSNLAGLAQHLRESLRTIGSAKPLIFIAHSLGGLIVKEVIIALENAKSEENRKLLQSIYGAVFFGVPHQGMDVTSLLAMCDNGPNLELVSSLNSLNSYILDLQRRQFPRALQEGGHTEIFCFYETLQSPTARYNKNEKTGKWEMSGPDAFLVSKSSATCCRPSEDDEEHICGLRKGHSDLVKFDREDSDEILALQKIRDFTKRAIGGRERLENAQVKFIVPYRENPDFVGRTGLLEQVKKHFGLGPGSSSRVSDRLALYGLGGMGKTQIAIEFARWVGRMHHQIAVFWVHASTEARFRQGLARIAEEYKIPGREIPKADVAALVCEFLEQKHRHRWIMIIDNADDRGLFFPHSTDDTVKQVSPGLKRYFPQCDQGSILMTSRDADVASDFMLGKVPLEVGELTDEEALWMADRTLQQRNLIGEVSQLSQRLERLPLALAQALAFMNKKKCSIDGYIRLLDSSDKTLVAMLSEPFEASGRDDESPNAVTAAWIISFEQIEKTDPLAAEFISLMSLFDRQAIPGGFIDDYQKLRRGSESFDDGMDALSRTKSLGTLIAYSFITETTDGSYDMHRLVQLVMRKWLVKEENLGVFRPHALSVLYRAYPIVRFENLDQIMRLLPHTKAVLAQQVSEKETKRTATERGQLLLWMGYYFEHKSQYADAEQVAEQAYRLFDAALGAGDEKTLYAVNLLLNLYHLREHFDMEWAEEKRRRSEQALGPKHEATLRITRTLAMLYWRQGRLEEAGDVLREVVETRRSKLPTDSTGLINAMGALAGVYLGQGRLDEAEKLQLELVETTQRALGHHDPRTLGSLYSLAITYGEQGRHEEEGEILEGVVGTAKKPEVLGPEHDFTLMALASFALSHHRLGNLEQAEEVGSKVWRSEQQKLGQNHPITLACQHNYASYLMSSGQVQDAVGLMRDCWSREKRALGAEHPNTLSSQRRLQKWEEEMDGSA